MDIHFGKGISVVLLAVVLILLLPLVAMQFTDEVVWKVGDFVVAGVLLFGTGSAFLLATRKSGTLAFRTAVGVALGAALFLVWVNLAVGILGTEDNPANILYLGVLAVGIIGALAARLRPYGMAYALFAAALTQALVPGVALLIGWLQIGSLEEFLGVLNGLIANTFFVVLFVESGLLFRHANITAHEAAAGAITSGEVRLRDKALISNLVSWNFALAFIGLGILNLFLVHPVPGLFYLLLSIVYLPWTNIMLKAKAGFSIPLLVKIIVGLVVLWGTLAVGDLAEMAGM